MTGELVFRSAGMTGGFVTNAAARRDGLVPFGVPVMFPRANAPQVNYERYELAVELPARTPEDRLAIFANECGVVVPTPACELTPYATPRLFSDD